MTSFCTIQDLRTPDNNRRTTFERTIRVDCSADGELLHHKYVELFSATKGLVLFVTLGISWYMIMDAERLEQSLFWPLENKQDERKRKKFWDS